jgi:sulfopyruvate decarboxylase subunit beta
MATETELRPAMRRWDALEAIADAYPTDPIVVTLGGTTRELAAMRRSANHLYVLDSMGLPPALGVGLALGLEESAFDKIVVLEGDGSLLMGFSTLPTIALTKPKKLVLIILDNGVYSATGNQPTAAGAVDLCAVAAACGMTTRTVDDLAELRSALEWTRSTEGPLFLRVRTSVEAARVPFLLEDPVVLGHVFADYVAKKK